MELYDLPLHELHRRRLQREVSTVEICEAVLRRIETYENSVHAYITLTLDDLLDNARRVDERLARGEEVSPVAGMPIAIKDIFTTRGVETTCGSRILEGFVPPYDATVVARLKAHGLNMTGKTNMDEFAMGSSTETSAYGPTRNPWDGSRVPGGSSGGSAAAVAAGEAVAAIGTDTGGSIRQPAAFTSLVGFKPTYGRVSRYGMVAFASSLDQGGPMTRDVRDAALLLGLICGQDERDATSSAREVPDFTGALRTDLKGVKVGLVQQFRASEQLEPAVARAFDANVETLRQLGAEVREVSLPSLEHALAVYYILAPSEASSNLGRYDGVRYGLRAEGAQNLEQMYRRTREEGFGAEVKRRIMLGTFALSAGYYDAYYVRAMRLRDLVRAEFQRAHDEVDVIATPTSPLPAFKLGEKLNDPLRMYLVDAFTIPVNLAGLPAVSVPGGFTDEGLPLGLQFIGAPFHEAAVLGVASGFEAHTDFHTRRPRLQ